MKGDVKLRIFQRETDLMNAFGIDRELEKVLRPKVWLKSGGYLVINQTEALVTIDVNTGRFVGRKDQESTILRTNLDAAREVALIDQLSR